jgi:hypothetical protein
MRRFKIKKIETNQKKNIPNNNKHELVVVALLREKLKEEETEILKKTY